jgi:anthranilate phosphoribosyltransferase
MTTAQTAPGVTTATTPATFAEAWRELESPAGLTAVTARRAFDAVLSGAWTPAQIAGLLVGLRLVPENADVFAAAVQSMRAAMVRLEHGYDHVVDTCGTGGDGLATLNISTAAAIVVAAAGHPVAKHGNRAVSSRSGSADVLAALGIPMDLDATQSGAVLREVGISFLLAPTHHPAMRFAMPVRRELGIRTIFNCLGPMANPASATHQLVGAFSNDVRPLIAATLAKVGTVRAWVVCGKDGLDEVSPFVSTSVTEVFRGRIREFEVTPADFGLTPSPAGAIAGGEGSENATQLEAILSNVPHPATDAVLLNAAAALVVAEDIDPKLATTKARQLIQSGAARQKLEDWRTVAQRQKGQRQ